MKKILLYSILILSSNNVLLYSQEGIIQKDYPENQVLVIPRNHNPNFKVFPEKSFYQSKVDWQYTIDTTWGPGVPLPQKLQLYNTFSQKLHDEFDGFLSLQLNWDSLYNFYLAQINDSTSKGDFASIMGHLAYDLKDMHTWARDTVVLYTPLNPGIPILLMGSYLTVEHFGAVTTILPDSTTLVLRVVPNHPLNLEPGDIILGYEGVPWKILVKELLDAGLPIFNRTGGCRSADEYLNLFGVGLNWHLFNTIDILKHSTGDTLHLSVASLLNLNVSPMLNNEQMPIPNIPFPDMFNNQLVTYGILENTNIGHIYLFRELPQAIADAQFYEAVNALKNTDALIIDMRFNMGGWALFDDAFEILFNDFYQTIADAYRCNTFTFELCPANNWQDYKINGIPPLYDRPIAVLLGPTCVSMGDCTAQRLLYHPIAKFFGKSSDASLGFSHFVENFPDWQIRYSVGDMYHTSEPNVYLNRREFPIDFPVWHNPDDVAMGKDAVVEKALEWINNVVYPHNILTDRTFYQTGSDSVELSTIIENPNSHQLSARGYVYNISNMLIDSVDLVKQSLNTTGEFWTGNLNTPTTEDFFKVSVTAFDQTASSSFSLPNATRFTTAGPVVLDSISINKVTDYYSVKPFVKNLSSVTTITSASIKLICDDSWITSITPASRPLPNIPPGTIVGPSSGFTVRVDSTFTDYFNFKVEISSGNWAYWRDSSQVVVGVEDEIPLPTEFTLEQNFPNPFNPSTKIKCSVPFVETHRDASLLVTLKVYDVLGNEIETLVNEEKSEGTYEVTWHAANLPSGVYFYQLKAGEFANTKKMILLK
jgi:hypothetical protein